MSHLFNVTLAYGLRVHGFTLMDNHFHLLASTPFGNLGGIMNYFMRETSKEVNRRTKRINHVYGGRYKASCVLDSHHYYNVFRYIYQNPLRAKICTHVEDYPYTTLRTLFGQDNFVLPIYPSVFDAHFPITNNYDKASPWLNRLIEKRLCDGLSRGLQKTQFSLPVDRISRQPIDVSESELEEIDALLNQK